MNNTQLKNWEGQESKQETIPAYPRSVFERIARNVPSSPKRRLLDVGCRTGEITRCLARHIKCLSVTGVDRDALRIAQARVNYAPRTAFLAADAAEIGKPESGEKFVAITAFDSFAGFENDEKALANIKGLLAHGCFFFVVETYIFLDAYPATSEVLKQYVETVPRSPVHLGGTKNTLKAFGFEAMAFSESHTARWSVQHALERLEATREWKKIPIEKRSLVKEQIGRILSSASWEAPYVEVPVSISVTMGANMS